MFLLVISRTFLVRESSVPGGFVVSYVFNGRTFHAQVLPDVISSGNDLVSYSLDEGKTKFFDLLQVKKNFNETCFTCTILFCSPFH